MDAKKENNDMNQLALEEFKLLQGIAEAQETLRFKIRSWCVALITALSVAVLSQKIQFSVCQFLLIATVIMLMFLWLDVLYRVAQDWALRRAKLVEESLRGLIKYDGPKVRESLSAPNSVADQVLSLNNVRVYGPYLLLLVILVVVAAYS